MPLIDIKYARALDEKDSYDGLFVKVEDPAFAASVRDEIEGLGLTAHSAQDVIDEVNKLMVVNTMIISVFKLKNHKIYFLGNTNKISKSLYIASNIILL